MKKSILWATSAFLLFINFSNAQVKRFYFTSGGELIFSSAKVSGPEENGDANLRFTGFINFNSLLHYNVSKGVGFYSGMELQNVGFIYKSKIDESTTKFRTYNFGIPIGVKLGAVDKVHFFAAYSIEAPIHYKEKVFIKNEVSHTKSEWFSKNSPKYNHALSAGVQLPHGLGIKVKYYLNNFFSEAVAERHGSDNSQENMISDAHLFYLSLTYNVFKSKRVTFNPFY
jgi:hypothetical protein